jgi:Arc/MetJ-type ribon-helix-helix transcriptional regulator
MEGEPIMTIEIHRPELERRFLEGIQSGRFRDAEELLMTALDALLEKERSAETNQTTAAAARRLGTFGKRHGLSLGDITVQELLRESRP